MASLLARALRPAAAAAWARAATVAATRGHMTGATGSGAGQRPNFPADGKTLKDFVAPSDSAPSDKEAKGGLADDAPCATRARWMQGPIHADPISGHPRYLTPDPAPKQRIYFEVGFFLSFFFSCRCICLALTRARARAARRTGAR